MPAAFVHLHNHSSYSLLDGLARIDDLLNAAVAAEMPALALTDHGTMFGAVEFISKAREVGVKPIIGCEVYVSDRPLAEKPNAAAENFHLVLLAETDAGYHNLIRLTTEAHVRGFYRKPRVDHDLLERYSEGLICLSGCASSEVSRHILRDDLAGAEKLVEWYRQVFNDRYYLELQHHNLEFQTKINAGILQIGDKLNLPFVATNDVHYVEERHARTHEILLCIQTQTTLDDPKRMRMETQEFYLKSPDQMSALFGHVPGAISNTVEIADRCQFDLQFGRPLFPTIATPPGVTASEQLRLLCEEGLAKRYPGDATVAREQLNHELEIIESAGFVEYLLLVHDVMHFARSQGIAVGPGRGSAVGSLVAYCLYVTNVDPIALGLSFERFLNLERVSMPDMDLDFADDRRDEVIRYVTEKFGRERVAQIITFGTIGPRAGVRDVGRVLGMPYGDVDRVAKLIPFACNKTARAREETPELQQLYESDPNIHGLLDTVEDLEGVARHASTHAAGVVISRDPLIDHVPLYKVPKSNAVTTQYAMASIEQIGLLKMDFLGLRTLTILERACALIRQTTGSSLIPDDIPLTDASIYELLSTGDTFGVFQVDGQGMRKLIKHLKPSELEHVVALVALYRPGPMQYIEEFAARKNGERPVHYDHPALETVLAGTYGIVVYQEQVMQLAVLVAGYTMGEGDMLRRVMGKKKVEELAKHRQQFIDRAAARGTERDVANHLFNVIEPFAGYAFNKAHAAAYAVLTCQTAYLKANYPREYLAGLLSAERENSERVAEALHECRRLGIGVLAPDVNLSEFDFTLEEAGIRFGLSAVKHAGSNAIEALLREREQNGPFASLEDLCTRIDWSVLNKRVLESLVKCGALDSLGVERGQMISGLDRLVGFGVQTQRAAATGQVSLFGETSAAVSMLQLAISEPASVEARVGWEQELLGAIFTPHPIIDASARLSELQVLSVSAIGVEHHNALVRVGGLVRGLRSQSTRAGQPMACFDLTDLASTVEAIVFSRAYQACQGIVKDGLIVVADGRLDTNDGNVRLLVDSVCLLDDAVVKVKNGNARHPANGNGAMRGKANGPEPQVARAAALPPGKPSNKRLSIEINRSEDRDQDAERILAIYSILQRYPGSDDLEILVRRGKRLWSIPLPVASVGICAQLEAELLPIAGKAAMRVKAAMGGR